MSDLHDQMEREARRIEAAPDALTKTHARALSRQRQHRLLSGLIAFAMAATGIFVAVRTFDPTGEPAGPRPAGSTGSTLPIWPSPGIGTDAAYLDGIQRQVDQGHRAGFLSPEIVAQMFAMEVMGWERDDIEVAVRGDEPVQALIANPSVSSAAGATSDVRTILTMERWRGREDGIFVITHADAEILNLRAPTPGQPIPAADEMTFSGAIEGISQRLLALSLSISIEGESSFGSYERITPKEAEETLDPPKPGSSGDLPKELRGTGSIEIVPGPDGGFATAVPVPEAFPSSPGVSVFVQNATGEKLTVESFRLGPTASREGAPIPGPTPTSDDATPAPVQVEVADGTGDPHASSYLGVLLQDRGRGTHHGGYSIVATIDPTTGDFIGMERTKAIDRTVISRVPGADDEAERLRQLFFPDAEIRGRVPGSGSPAPIRIHLGRDFLVTEAEGLEVFNFVEDFLETRLFGGRAERYLSPEALRLYESRRGGLSLYGYFSHEVGEDSAGVRALQEEADGSWRAVVALTGKGNGTRFETLELTRVSDTDITQWTITYAERNA